jgi:hypothetical protein
MPELKFERFLKPPSSHAAAASTPTSLTKKPSLFSVASSSASSLLGGISKSMGMGIIGSPLRSAALAASASASSLLRLSSPLLSSLSPSPLSPSSSSSAHSFDDANVSESLSHTQPVAEAAVLDLPRGAALIIGGDLAYPTPTPEMYEKRLFAPFQVLCSTHLFTHDSKQRIYIYAFVRKRTIKIYI